MSKRTKSLSVSEIYLDEMTKRFRLVQPDEHHLARNLIDLADEVSEEGEDFVKYLAEISDLMDKMAQLVHEAKMDSIGRRCQLLISANRRETAIKVWQEEIAEKRAQVERNQLYYESLVRQKQDQTELLTRIFRK